MRLFVAIPAGSLAASLEPLIAGYGERAPFIPWLPASALHLTLRFLGDLPETSVSEIEAWIDSALDGAPPVQLRAQKTGLFRKKDRVVLYVQLAPDAGLQLLARRLATPIAGLPTDTQQFVPHLTLARYAVTPADAARFRAFLDWFGHSRMPVTVEQSPRVVLYRSDLTPAGAVHTPLREWPSRG